MLAGMSFGDSILLYLKHFFLYLILMSFVSHFGFILLFGCEKLSCQRLIYIFIRIIN